MTNEVKKGPPPQGIIREPGKIYPVGKPPEKPAPVKTPRKGKVKEVWT